MTMKRKLIASNSLPMAIAMSGMLLLGAWSVQSCVDKEDNILTGQPEWLGNSIYERLENDPDGQKYTTLLRLVDDLGQKEVLAHTGSKTIFAADDDAFDRWFQSNTWGVRSYDELTQSQKSLLFNTCMVNNAYLIELLSNKAAESSSELPTKGGSMRRLTAATIYDTVSYLNPADMPAVAKGWQNLQAKGKTVRMFRDATARPIIHLLPEYMRVNGFTNDDVEILTNHHSHNVNVSWVNGVEVTKENVTCKNGYIHKIADVMEPVDNMAEILRKHPDTMKRWSELLDRFSAPYPATLYQSPSTNEGRTIQQDFTRLYNETDTAYVLRYFSLRSMGGNANNTLPDGETETPGNLSFDPGWNQYIYKGQDVDYRNDAGAMLVPTTEALDAWFNSGDGQDIKDKYGTWDNVPEDILVDLLNNCLLDNFAGTVPSKFNTIVDDAQMSMNVKPTDIKACYMGCNGMVYLTDQVFAPSSFKSVAFPAKINADKFSISSWVIERLGSDVVNESSSITNEFCPYKSILSSMESYYSLLLPSNESFRFIDPTLYGSPAPMLYELYYNTDDGAVLKTRVKARRYQMNETSPGVFERESSYADVPLSVLRNRLEDFLNQLIIEEPLNSGQEFYLTRAGTMVRIKNPDATDGTMTVEGGYQLEGNNPITEDGAPNAAYVSPIPVTKVFDKSGSGNGKSYQMDAALPMCSSHSLNSMLKTDPANCSKFLELIDQADLLTETQTVNINGTEVDLKPNNKHSNFKLFDNYNYTVYVPSNSAIQRLQDLGFLPKVEDLDQSANYSDDKQRDKAETWIKKRITDFVRYHVQDNSVAIGGRKLTDQDYESYMVNPANYRFYPLRVNANATELKVRGQWILDDAGVALPTYDASGNTVDGRDLSVDTASGFYNKMVREFWNQGASQTSTSKLIYSSSAAVVHLLKDGCLLYSDTQLQDWKTALNTYMNQ